MAGITTALTFGLAVWRASIMVTREEGPLDVFLRLREAAGAEELGTLTEWGRLSSLGKLLQCPYCISVWLALALWVLRLISKPAYNIVVMSLFGSSVTALIEDYYVSNANS